MTHEEMRQRAHTAAEEAAAAIDELSRATKLEHQEGISKTAVFWLDVAERWYRLAELERGPIITLPPSKEWDQ